MENEQIVVTIQSVCRTCMSLTPNFTSLFSLVSVSNRKESVSWILLKCTSIQVSKADLLPQNICNVCLNQLIKAYSFRQLCLETQDKLSEELCETSLPTTNSDETDNVKIECIEKDIKNDVLDSDTSESGESKELNNQSYPEDCSDDQANKTSYPEDCSDDQANKTIIKSVNVKNTNKRRVRQKGKIQRKKLHNCTICDRTFYYPSDLTNHIRRHMNDKPYRCTSCNSSYVCKVELSRHMLKHMGERPFVCKVCSESFTKSFMLSEHMEIHNTVFKCKVCFQTYPTLNKLNIHKRCHTGNKCHFCGKRLSSLNNLSRHIATHYDDKPFVCKICGKSFRRKDHMKAHVTTHTKW